MTKVILFPVSLWAQRNSVKMIKIQPQFNMIAAQYAGDRDRIAEEQLKLYKQENYKPLIGVIPLLIQIPLILGVISVVYAPLTHILRLESGLIGAFVAEAGKLLGMEELGLSAQLRVLELIKGGQTAAFSAVPITGAAEAVAQIQALDMRFLGFDLSVIPSIKVWDKMLLVPLLSAGSSLLLSVEQNRVNVLQKEASWLGKWGMAIFLTLFSLYFAFVVPAGVGLYWILGNLFGILSMHLVNVIYPPQKYIDYEALEESKKALAASKEVEKAMKPTAEQKKRVKEDYKRFCDEKNVKRLVFYSEKSGFYRYFAGLIDSILAQSDVDIHYVTSDPNDAVFKMGNPRLIPYYIDDNRLIPLFMKMDADVVVMTMTDLQQYHLKRSLVRKDIEYIYVFHAMVSTQMIYRKGSFDHYDTVFCVGPHHMREIREMEAVYGLPEKRLIEFGYPLLDDLRKKYEALCERKGAGQFQVLIAPSHQEGNIMDSCLDEILSQLQSNDCKLIVRPHPQYVRRNPAKIGQMKERYRNRADILFETDFTTDDSLYTSDVMITDWSGISMEYSFSTKKPCIFINTPMKVLNPDYKDIASIPVEISLRDRIGVSVDLEELDDLPELIEEIQAGKRLTASEIGEIAHATVYHVGNRGEAGANYIIEEIMKRQK